MPALVDAPTQVGAGGSLAKKGTGYGQARVDPAGPDPAHFEVGQRRRLALPSGGKLRLGGVAEGEMTLDGRFESKQSP